MINQRFLAGIADLRKPMDKIIRRLKPVYFRNLKVAATLAIFFLLCSCTKKVAEVKGLSGRNNWTERR